MTENVWLVVIPILSTIMLTFFGAVGAVWTILSKRIAALQASLDAQGLILIQTSEAKAKAEAERDLFKERGADLKQRLTVKELEVSEYKTMLSQALDMRKTVEEMSALRMQVDALREFVGDRRKTPPTNEPI